MIEPTKYEQLLADLLLTNQCDLFQGTDGDLYVCLETLHGKTTLPLDSDEGWARITDMFVKTTNHTLLKTEMEQGARLSYGRLLASGKPAREVFLRVGHDADAYYLDLHTQPKTYVRFNAENGWSRETEVPVHFREGQGQMPMQLPLGISDDNEGFRTLRGLLTVNDMQWHCLLPLLVSYMLPDIQHPLLLLTGEQNSGKSTFVEVIKTLVDPDKAMIGGDVPDPRNLFIRVNSTWLPTFDNLSSLDGKQQDAICQIVTGGTYQTRRLWSNKGQITITCKNPVILAGINNVANRGDIASRAVLFNLESIDRQGKYISAEAITRKIRDAAPSILRALLNLTVAVLKLRPQLEAPQYVRPAAYGVIGRAVEAIMGWRPSTFEKAYHVTRQPLQEDVLKSYVVIETLVSHLESYKLAGEYKETPRALLAMLVIRENNEHVTRSKMWPVSEATFGKMLRSCAPALRKQTGWHFEPDHDMQNRYFKFTYKPAAVEAEAEPLALPVIPLASHNPNPKAAKASE